MCPGDEEAGAGARDPEHVGRRHAGGGLHPPPLLLRLDMSRHVMSCPMSTLTVNLFASQKSQVG